MLMLHLLGPLSATCKRTCWHNCYTWLFFKSGSLGCTDAKALLLSEKGHCTHLSKVWINRDVSSYAQNQLHKKLAFKKPSALMKRRIKHCTYIRQINRELE